MKVLVLLAACAGPSDVTGTATISFGDQQVPQASASFIPDQSGVEVSFYAAPANTACDERFQYPMLGSMHLYPTPMGPPYDTVQLGAENGVEIADAGPIQVGQVEIYAVGSELVSARIVGTDSTGRHDVLGFLARPCSTD